MNMQNSILRGFLVALVVAMLAACTETPEGMVASAKEHLAKGDQKAAVIQLKNALQTNPALAEARFLLGKALLDSGDALAAGAQRGLGSICNRSHVRRELRPHRNLGSAHHPFTHFVHHCEILAHRCAHLAFGQAMWTRKIQP